MADYDPTTFTGDSGLTVFNSPIEGAKLIRYYDDVIMPKMVVIPTPPQCSDHAAILGLAAEVEALTLELKELKNADN